jgi:hypothetical protein
MLLLQRKLLAGSGRLDESEKKNPKLLLSGSVRVSAEGSWKTGMLRWECYYIKKQVFSVNTPVLK